VTSVTLVTLKMYKLVTRIVQDSTVKRNTVKSSTVQAHEYRWYSTVLYRTGHQNTILYSAETSVLVHDPPAQVDAETVAAIGDARDVICKYVDEHHCDMLVVGSRGLGGIKR